VETATVAAQASAIAGKASAIAGEATAIVGKATAIQGEVTKNHAAGQEENAKIFCYRRDCTQVVDCA
jgi:hypothetical protein